MSVDNNKNKRSSDNNSGKKNNKNNKFSIFNFLLIGLILTIIINMIITSISSRAMVQIKYNQFLELLDNNIVESVVLKNDRILIHLKKDSDANKILEIVSKEEDVKNELLEKLTAKNPEVDNVIKEQIPMKTYYTGYIQDPKLIDRLENAKGLDYSSDVINKNPILDFAISWIFPLLFFYIIISLLMGSMSKRMSGGGFMNIGKSNPKKYDMEKQTGVKFEDVAGQDEAKESLTEIVDLLHNPKKYAEIGAKQPKGALLVGPPGTGKTLLAKAVAGEANVPFFSLSGSEFVELYVGVGASRVRDLFKQANTHAPCIVFIDEIDAIGKSRDSKLGGGNDEREQTLNQLLAEMDGFDNSKGIIVLAATNRPEILDKALLRPGRFDRTIIVEKPDLRGRESILKVHSKKVKLGPDVNFNKIALATSGAAGADLANMVNEAALRAVRMGRKEVLQEDLMEAVEVVIAGKEKKDRVLSTKEKRWVAFHEVGHALSAALQKNTQPVQKITIVPRTMGALGYTMQMPEEEKFLMDREEIIEQIVVMLSGRAAEEIEFNIATTGASNDIERSTKMARSMVTQYGMSKEFGMMGLESVENRYLDGRPVLTCSDATGKDIDREVKKIMEECYSKAKKILSDNRLALTRISEFLIKEETITGEQFLAILEETKNVNPIIE